MKWKARQQNDLTQWRRWFAWYPVRVGADIVWLEWVERRFSYDPVHGVLYAPRFQHPARDEASALEKASAVISTMTSHDTTSSRSPFELSVISRMSGCSVISIAESSVFSSGPFCDICDGGRSYRCPTCFKPVSHSHEGDYTCVVHDFVNPVRDDGAIIAGDGCDGVPRVIGWVWP